SLAHAGRFLRNEMARVVRAPARASFVCHSAGGLVFRYYAERLGGALDPAPLLGAPHAGSRVQPLEHLADLAEFARDLRFGLPRAITATLTEGDGALTPDVQPDSLFLRHLGHDPKLARRYEVVYGNCLTDARTRWALRVALAVTKVAL